MKTSISIKTILLAGVCVCAIGAAQAGFFDGISKATSSVTGLLSDSGSAAQIKKSDIKYDGTVRLVSKTYGNVAVKPDDLKPGDFTRNNSGWLEATKQWEERHAAELELVAKAEAEKREARVQAEIKRATKEDGMVELCSYGGRGYDGSILGRGSAVMVLVSELQPGDVAIVESGAYFGRLTTTQQWEDRCRVAYDAKQEELRKAKLEAERIAREAKEAEERAERERIAREKAAKLEAERAEREKKYKAEEDAFIEKFRAEIQEGVGVINNIHSNLYQSLYAISTNELLRGTRWGEEPIMDTATKLITKWQDSEYVNWTNKTCDSELVFVEMPENENPWNIGISPSFLNMAEKKLRASGYDAGHIMAHDYYTCQINQPSRYYEYDNFVESTKKYLVRLEKKVAAQKELEAKAVVASKLIAEMPEAEKFPLLSVQPKPQMLMKGVPSGASVKWVEGWLTANKATFGEVEREMFADLLCYKLRGLSPRYTGYDVIEATFNEDGKPTRKVFFRFKEGVLVGINIVLEGSIPTIDQLIEKYSRELGGNAKVERGNKGDVKEFAYSAKTPDEYDYFNQVRWFVQDCFANVANSDVNVRIDYKIFAGLIALSQDTRAMLSMLGAEEQARYLEFGKDGKADLIVCADGNVLRCTSEGKTLKGWVAGASKLEICKQKVESITDKVIKVEDKKLKAHFDAIEERKTEAARKAAEEAKKKADAAALDF